MKAKAEPRRGYARLLHVLFCVCGALSFVAFASYFCKLLFWHEAALSYIITVAALLLIGVPLFGNRCFEKRLPRRLYFILKNAYTCLLAVYLVTFLALCGYIAATNQMQEKPEDLNEQTVFVVYGAGIRGERPGSVLKKRLNKTAEYLAAVPGSVCIVTGGQGSDEVKPEADVMRDYLVEDCGVDPSRIYTEPKARNTIENVKYSMEIMEAEGMEDYTVVSVSNAFHIPRIRLICGRLGCDGAFVLAKDPNPFALYSALVREYLSYAKLFLFGTE